MLEMDKRSNKLKRYVKMYTVIVMLSICLCMTQTVTINPDTAALTCKILDIPLVAQETRMWCWAASGEMITAYYGSSIAQHKQVNNRFRRNDCGNTPRPRHCIRGGWPEFEKYGFNRPEHRYGALSWQELVRQIDAGKPVGFSWEWKACKKCKSNGSHYMVARGYIIYKQTRLVVVNDPWPASPVKPDGGSVLVMTYRDYNEFYPRYCHSYTHYNITKKGEPIQGIQKQLNTLTGNQANPAGTAETAAAEDVETAQQQNPDPIELINALPKTILREMGFPPLMNPGKIKLGKPLAVYIGRSRLLKFLQPDIETAALPQHANEAHYPVLVDNEPVTSVTMRKRDGHWVFAQIGDKKALAAVKARKETPLPKGDTPDFFMVDIQAMDLSFLGYFSGNSLYLVPILYDPDLSFPLFQPVPADVVLMELEYLAEQMIAETDGTMPGNRFNKNMAGMAEALADVGCGKKELAIRGLNDAVNILNRVLTQIENQS
jgi:hypothetical protein